MGGPLFAGTHRLNSHAGSFSGKISSYACGLLGTKVSHSGLSTVDDTEQSVGSIEEYGRV